MTEVAEKLQELFKASSYTSWNELRDDVLFRLGKDFTPSAETIKQMHTPGGKGAKIPDPIVLGTICSLYGQPVEAVSPEVATLLRTLKTRLGRSIDLRELHRSCDELAGSFDLRLFDPDAPSTFDQDALPVVIDLRDRVVEKLSHVESIALYAIAN